MDFQQILGIVIMVVGIIISLFIYYAFSDALDCTTLTGYDSSTPANSTDAAKACLDTKTNANIVFGIIPIFIILGLVPLIRGTLSKGL